MNRFLAFGLSIGLASVCSGQEAFLQPTPTEPSRQSFLGTPQGNAVGILNAFIASFCKDNPSWKTEIVLLSDPNEVPPGKQLGYSAQLQTYYSFRPKFWEEMKDAEQQAVLKDPRLKSFLVSVRNQMIFPSVTNADTHIPTTKNVFPVEGVRSGNTRLVPAGAAVVEDPNKPLYIKIAPEEMILDRPFDVIVE
jgi:hypothetical protein